MSTMATPTHTPGPWAPGLLPGDISDAEGRLIGRAYDGFTHTRAGCSAPPITEQERMANAALMQAAPMLYGALVVLMELNAVRLAVEAHGLEDVIAGALAAARGEG